MRTLVFLIAATLMAACGSSTPTPANTAPVAETKPAGPPWDSLSPQDKVRYTDTLACPRTTAMVKQMAQWPLANLKNKPNPMNSKEVPGSLVYVHRAPSGLMALLHRQGAAPSGVIDMVVILVPNTNGILILDYHVMRSLDIKTADATSLGTILSVATGEYFCAYQ